MRSRRILTASAMLVFGALTARAAEPRALYLGDVAFALDALEEKCGHFFELKDIDWKKVRAQFLREARGVRSDEDHYVLLVRLLARLEDGHAAVRPLPAGKDIRWPLEQKRQGGPGMFWCVSKKKVLVKSAWSAAAEAGVQPGMEVVKVDGIPVGRWLEQKVEERSDLGGFSTDHQALYAACHWGLGGDLGSKMALELRLPNRKRGRVAVTRGRASQIPVGPVFPPEGLERIGRQSYGRTERGFGYIHLRDVPGDLPDQMDKMLGAIGEVPGIILDCRANGGGGCDHDAVLGRFVPAGKTLQRARAYPIPSAGTNPYGGPVVVIVDAGCRSAGETVSGMFKEDGRAYMIGETPTAGSSSQKTTVELPSGLFSLYVSVRSNKARFNGGRGIEGIGVIPHQLVEYDQKDLARGNDTLILYAEALLAKFPREKVPYRPEEHGWKKPR